MQKKNEEDDEELMNVLDSLREREKKSILRAIQAHVIRWDPERKKLVHCEGNNRGEEFEYKEGESDEEMDSDSDEEKEVVSAMEEK